MLPSEIDSGDGRKFALREIGPADMLDLIEAGGDASSNGTWMRYALLISSVSAIDGTPVLLPATKNALRDLGRRIGNIGLEALAAVHYADEPDGAEESKSEGNAAKN